MKKLTAILITAFILILSVPFLSASAETELETAIRSALEQHKSSLDISKYNYDEDEAAEVFFRFLLNAPELFYSDAAIDFDMAKDNVHVSKYEFVYLMSASEAKTATVKYNEKLDEIISYMPDDLDDFGKILWIHNYICENFEYDDDEEIYDAYNMLMQGKGVCQGYTLLFDALLERVGINSRYVDSEEINHIWNIVELDGEWYYVDTTWDDPEFCAYGEVYYDYFMLSEDAFFADGEHGDDYVAEHDCDDYKYDDCGWRMTASAMAPIGTDYYYTIELDMYSFDRDTCKEEIVYSLDPEFCVTDYAEFENDYFMGFGSLYGKLLFGVTDGIVAMDPETFETTTLYQMPEGAGGVISSHYVADTGYYALCAADDEDYDHVTYGSFKIDLPDPSLAYKPGDVNENGEIDANDYLLLKRAYFGTYELSKTQTLAADLNNNKIIDTRDYALLKRAVLGSYVIPEK